MKRPIASRPVARLQPPVITPEELAEQIWAEGRRQWAKKLRDEEDRILYVNKGYELFLDKMSAQGRKVYWTELVGAVPPISPFQALKNDPAVIMILQERLSAALRDMNVGHPMKDVTPKKIGSPITVSKDKAGKGLSRPDKELK